jgi:hypothetical protein
VNSFRNVSDGVHELPLVSSFFIRGRHPACFRQGQWAKVVEVAWCQPPTDGVARPVYVVEFIDGRRDLWPVYDSAADYEFAREPK